MAKGKSTKSFLNTEEWRVIEDFPNYMVSSVGRVVRLGCVGRTPLGDSFYKKERFIKSNGSLRRGYPSVSLYNDSTHKVVCVHKLVAKAFIANPDNKPEVNHIDGDKTNNRASNLEWCSSKENKKHAVDVGLIKTGCKHKLSVLTPEQVRDIRMNCVTSKRGFSQMDFARKYGVSHGCIKDLLCGKTYRYEETAYL